MRREINVLRDGGIYTATNLLNSFIPFLLLPGYTKALTPAEFGLLSIYENMVFFLMPILMFGISGVLSVDYFRKKRIFTILFSSAFVIPVSMFSLLSVGTLVAMIGGYQNVHLEYEYVFMVLGIGLLQVFTLLRLMLYQVKKQPLKYLFVQGWVILSSVLFTLYFVVYDDWGWAGRIQALFIAYLFAGAFSFLSFLKEGCLDRSAVVARKVRYVFGIGFPLVPHALGMLFIVYFDRFLLVHYWGVEEVGVYAFAHQLGMGVSLLQNSFNQAWYPRFFELMKRSLYKDIKIVHRWFLFLLVCSVPLLYIFIHVVYEFLFDDAYSRALDFFFFIAIGFVFVGVYKMYVNVIFYYKRTRVLLWLAVLNVSVNLLLNLLLVPSLGAQGAALGLLCSMVALAWFTRMISKKVFESEIL